MGQALATALTDVGLSKLIPWLNDELAAEPRDWVSSHAVCILGVCTHWSMRACGLYTRVYIA